MLYFSRLANSILCICCSGLILGQRDVDNELLINGWHGLALVCGVLFVAAFVNFKGALDALLLDCEWR